jgi:hypothetical protein
MPFITFIYRVGKNRRTYYGKYCSDYISDDHDGLDREIRHVLLRGLNAYRHSRQLRKLNTFVHIGVLSFSSDNITPVYSSDKEFSCFDFYCDYDNKIYVNGRPV